jgi:CPA2 family monovalent cation:H+ antiporter-2
MQDTATPLIAIISVGIVLAFILGFLANRLRVSPLVGYLLAGVVIGPFTPGFVGDPKLAQELAELGVILLMFAVGLHFSPRDLARVRLIAVPGALVQMGAATLLGTGFGLLQGWGLGAGIVFGLSLSVASTVVLLRALQERRILETERGRIAVGWLIVEDIAMVLVLVLLPTIAALSAAETAARPVDVALAAGLVLLKVAVFVAVMLFGGRRFIPWLLHGVAHSGSKELFRLAVFAVALGVAYAAHGLFDVSFALGAFFAGMVLSESQLSQRAAQEALPLRDAFAVLFFVSVGMLFDPGIVLRDPLGVIATVAVIVVGKSVAAYAIVRAFGHARQTALTISASLAQIGEFSFILAGLGVTLGLLGEAARDLVLAGAILSILINPALFFLIEAKGLELRPVRGPWVNLRPTPPRKVETGPNLPPPPGPAAVPEPAPAPPTTLTGHDVLVGFGRVGSEVGRGLRAAGRPVLVIEERADQADTARAEGFQVIVGNAADPAVLARANLGAAARVLVTLPEAFEAGQVVEQARRARPDLPILVRAHNEEEVAHLAAHGASAVVVAEAELARRFLGLAGAAAA